MCFSQEIIRFSQRVVDHRNTLNSLLHSLRHKKVFAYGASTKGNVVLQYCDITKEQIPYVLEVNKDKFDCITPGTNIPIISETEGKAMKPDYLLVMPWHFKTGIIEREKEYLNNGGKLIFPFPYVEVVGA